MAEKIERNLPGVGILKLQKDDWDSFYPEKTLTEAFNSINQDKRAVCIRHFQPHDPTTEHLHVLIALKFRNKKRPAFRNLLSKCADMEGRSDLLEHLASKAKMVDEEDVQPRTFALKYPSDFSVQMPHNLKDKFCNFMMHGVYHSLLADNPPKENDVVFCEPPIQVEEPMQADTGEGNGSEDHDEDEVKIANPSPPEFITLKGNFKCHTWPVTSPIVNP